MRPGVFDIGSPLAPVIRGTTYRRVIRLRSRVLDADGVTWVAGPYVDLDGYTGRAQVRPKAGDSSLSAEMGVTVLDQDVTPGGIELLLTSAQTWNLDPKVYAWELKLTEPDGDVQSYLLGAVHIGAAVTTVAP